MKTTLTAIAFLSILLLILVTSTKESTLVKGVQQGNLELYCHIDGGYKHIEPSKVKDLVDGTWVFTNGSARNCYIKGDK